MAHVRVGREETFVKSIPTAAALRRRGLDHWRNDVIVPEALLNQLQRTLGSISTARSFAVPAVACSHEAHRASENPRFALAPVSGRQPLRMGLPLCADTVEKVFLGGWSKFLEAAGALIGKRAGGLPAKASTEWRASTDPAR